jgi:hypothetical protein
MRCMIIGFLVLECMITPFDARAGSLLELRCEGITYIYENGFGFGRPLEANDTRIIKVNLTNNILETSTFHGNRIAKAEIGEDLFSAVLFHGFYYKGTYVYGEKVFINRYTGEINSMYLLSKDETKGYGAFSGTCRKGTKRF